MDYTTIRFSLDEGIGKVTLNRPERLNAFTSEMHAEVADALARIEESDDARVLILTGAGRGFCAGQDLSERKSVPGGPRADLGESIENRYAPLIRRLAALRVPTVCAVNGVAAGAGANIALACDLVVATASAKFIQSFANVGLMADAGGAWILPKLVGQARALGLTLTAEPIDAVIAAQWGMIWRAVPDDCFEAEIDILAARLARAPTLALTAVKRGIRGAAGTTLDEHLAAEATAQRKLGFSEDYVEGVAAFLEKRAPVFLGR